MLIWSQLSLTQKHAPLGPGQFCATMRGSWDSARAVRHGVVLPTLGHECPKGPPPATAAIRGGCALWGGMWQGGLHTPTNPTSTHTHTPTPTSPKIPPQTPHTATHTPTSLLNPTNNPIPTYTHTCHNPPHPPTLPHPAFKSKTLF